MTVRLSLFPLLFSFLCILIQGVYFRVTIYERIMFMLFVVSLLIYLVWCFFKDNKSIIERYSISKVAAIVCCFFLFLIATYIALPNAVALEVIPYYLVRDLLYFFLFVGVFLSYTGRIYKNNRVTAIGIYSQNERYILTLILIVAPFIGWILSAPGERFISPQVIIFPLLLYIAITDKKLMLRIASLLLYIGAVYLSFKSGGRLVFILSFAIPLFVLLIKYIGFFKLFMMVSFIIVIAAFLNHDYFIGQEYFNSPSSSASNRSIVNLFQGRMDASLYNRWMEITNSFSYMREKCSLVTGCGLGALYPNDGFLGYNNIIDINLMLSNHIHSTPFALWFRYGIFIFILYVFIFYISVRCFIKNISNKGFWLPSLCVMTWCIYGVLFNFLNESLFWMSMLWFSSEYKNTKMRHSEI